MKLSLLYYTQGKKINLLLLTILAKHLLSASLPWPTAWQSRDTGQPGTPHLQTKTNRQTEKSHQYHNTRPPFYLSALPLQCTTSQTRTYWALHFAESFHSSHPKTYLVKPNLCSYMPRRCQEPAQHWQDQLLFIAGWKSQQKNVRNPWFQCFITSVFLLVL